MVGWNDKRTEEQMVDQRDGQTDRRTDIRNNGQRERQTGRDGETTEETYGFSRTHIRTDGWKDRQAVE